MPTGTGTGTDPVRRVLARHIGYDGNENKVYGYAGGRLLCDPGSRFLGRLADFREHPTIEGEHLPIYLVSGECFKRVGVDYIDYTCPSGVGTGSGSGTPITYRISTIIKVQLNLTTTSVCFDDNICPSTELTFDNITSSWRGSISIGGTSAAISFGCLGDPTYPFIVTIGDICRGTASLTPSLPLTPSCEFPFRAGAAWPFTVPQNCCGNFLTAQLNIAVVVTGFQKARYLGRLVGYEPPGPGSQERPIYAVAEKCPTPGPCPEPETTCCGCEVSPNQWSFSIGGIIDPPPPGPCTACANFNGTWILTRRGNDTCQWFSDDAGSCTPGSSWTLSCGGPSGTTWQLQTQSMLGGTPGAQSYTLSAASWNCLGANTLTRVDADTGNCQGFPATITLTPV